VDGGGWRDCGGEGWVRLAKWLGKVCVDGGGSRDCGSEDWVRLAEWLGKVCVDGGGCSCGGGWRDCDGRPGKLPPEMAVINAFD
jgi:hypothetical protein